jgi:hypothetical protein
MNIFGKILVAQADRLYFLFKVMNFQLNLYKQIIV